VIGLFGGSFDPVHQGHVATAGELRSRFGFEEIRFLPAARSPLKAGVTANEHRLAMLRLALADKEGLTVDEDELHQPPPSYTIDTLRRVRSEIGPEQPLVFILGLDSFLELPRWKDWQALTDVAHLLVVSRPGSPPHFSPELAAWLAPRRTDAPGDLARNPHGQVLLAATAPHAIASRTIRAAIRAGQDTSNWLNPAVRDYIDRHHLYHGEANPQ
jgi:nicotinate-nucleotide adenylyltransferase